MSFLVSRLFGQNSVYETISQFDNELENHHDGLEERGGMVPQSESPWKARRPDQQSAGRSVFTRPASADNRLGDFHAAASSFQFTNKDVRVDQAEDDDGNDDVPGSLLVEARTDPEPVRLLHPVTDSIRPPKELRARPGLQSGDTVKAKELAMWKWANVENLDLFLDQVYQYFLGKGIYSIMLGRMLRLLTVTFVVAFAVFLTSCIDYSLVKTSNSLKSVLVPQCMSRISTTRTLLIWLFSMLSITKLFLDVLDLRRLWDMHNFYLYLLRVPDGDMQTISWQEVVRRLMQLRDANPITANNLQRRHVGSQSKQRMDAHDIANRLMRKENYLIAIFNKDILDVSLPIPIFRDQTFLTRTLEFNIKLCILDFIFNEKGHVRPIFLKDSYRKELSEGLRRRFILSGILNIIFAPFAVTYFILHYFFRYYAEFSKNPGLIGSRQYTPLAEWKFREFNELPHLFHRRMQMSYVYANEYVDQFPKDKTVQVLKFVAFVAGSFAAVLAVITVWDPELFLGYEITKDRTALFYITVFGTILAVSRGMIPDDREVFDPEATLKYVIEYIHYLPREWKDKLHSDKVKREFVKLFEVKVVIFLQELLSVIFTPFILIFSLPNSSERIIDFFREFTLHVDGIGYVCSFAVFDFQRNENLTDGLRDEYYASKDGKMLTSIHGFLDIYGKYPRQRTSAIRHPSHSHWQGARSTNFAKEASQAHSRWMHRPNPGAVGYRTQASEPTSFGPVQHGPLEPSLLLDPQHQLQTPVSHQVRSTKFSVKQPGRIPEDVVEEDAIYGEPVGEHVQSELGDSFEAAHLNMSSSSADDSRHDAGKAGVLGLLYQFQRAHTGTGDLSAGKSMI